MRRREFLVLAEVVSARSAWRPARRGAGRADRGTGRGAKPTTAPAAAPTDGAGGRGQADRGTRCRANHAPAAAAKPTTAPAAAAPAGSGGTLVYGLNGDFDDTLDPQVTNFDTQHPRHAQHLRAAGVGARAG